MSVPIYAFSGWSGSGKTTIIEKIVKKLSSEGLRVSVIKHVVHGLDFDQEGKDSWKFTEAGAHHVLLASPGRTVQIVRHEEPLEDLISCAEKGADVILIEGWKRDPLPCIGIARKAAGKQFPDLPETYTALICDFEVENSCVPRFEPDDIDGICNFIMHSSTSYRW